MTPGEKTAGGKPYLFIQNGDAPVIVWCTSRICREDAASLLREAAVRCGAPVFSLFMFAEEDWNAAFTPWRAETKRGVFGGRAEDTLAWLTEYAVPAIREKTAAPLILAGYSLAGLFALWCMSRTALFSAYVSCSGSLWFPGWEAYARQARARGECIVYLSLGDAEEKTKDPQMAAVRRMTVLQELLLARDPKVLNAVLRTEHGGHFNDPVGRLARGIAWTLLHAGEPPERVRPFSGPRQGRDK